MDKLSETYSSAEVCIDNAEWIRSKIPNGNKICLRGEPDLEELMSRRDLTYEQYLWIWKAWHDTVGPRVKEFYPDLVKLMNQGAINNRNKELYR